MRCVKCLEEWLDLFQKAGGSCLLEPCYGYRGGLGAASVSLKGAQNASKALQAFEGMKDQRLLPDMVS